MKTPAGRRKCLPLTWRRSQAVRRGTLTPSCVGSNPAVSASGSALASVDKNGPSVVAGHLSYGTEKPPDSASIQSITRWRLDQEGRAEKLFNGNLGYYVLLRRLADGARAARPLPWGYARFTPVWLSPKTPHKQLIRWFTSGFQ